MPFKLWKICLCCLPKNAAAVGAAEAGLVVDGLIGDDLLHFINPLAALLAHIGGIGCLHEQCQSESLHFFYQSRLQITLIFKWSVTDYRASIGTRSLNIISEIYLVLFFETDVAQKS